MPVAPPPLVQSHCVTWVDHHSILYSHKIMTCCLAFWIRAWHLIIRESAWICLGTLQTSINLLTFFNDSSVKYG